MKIVPVKKKDLPVQKIDNCALKKTEPWKIKFASVKTILLPVQKEQKSARGKRWVKKVKNGVKGGGEKTQVSLQKLKKW